MSAAFGFATIALSRAHRAPGRQPPPRGTEQAPVLSSIGGASAAAMSRSASGGLRDRSSARSRSIGSCGRKSEATLFIAGLQFERKGIASTLAGQFD